METFWINIDFNRVHYYKLLLHDKALSNLKVSKLETKK